MSALCCCDCGEVRESEELLASHISNDHLLWIPYECIYCSANDCTTRKASESELVKHIKQRHHGKDIKTLFIHDERQKSLLQHKLELSKKNPGGAVDGDARLVSLSLNAPNPATKIKLEQVITLDDDDDDDFKPNVVLPPDVNHSITRETTNVTLKEDDIASPNIFHDLSLNPQPNSDRKSKLNHSSRKRGGVFAENHDGYCNACKRHYARIRQHLRQKHLSSGVYKCSHCTYNTSSKVCIQIHISKPHGGEGEPRANKRSSEEVLDEVKMLEQTITNGIS